MANDRLYVDASDAANGNFYVMSVGNGVQQICSSQADADAVVANTGAGQP
jgi:hypothetical protein